MNTENADGNPKNKKTVTGFCTVVFANVSCPLVNLTEGFCKVTISFKFFCKITFVAPICVAFNIW